MDDGSSSLKKWKDKFFLIDRRAITDFLTWRHSCSCVSDDLPINGYDRNDVEWIDDNSEMTIYDFMTLPSWGDAKVVEESHHFSSSLLERVLSHTTAPTAEGAMILLPTPDEIVASLPDPTEPSRPSKKRKLKKKASEVDSSAPELGHAEGMNEADLTDFCAETEDSLEKDESISTKAASAPIPRLGKRLGAPPSMAVVSASEPSHVGTLVHASTSGRSLSLGGAVASGHAGKSGAHVLRRQVDPLDFLAHSALARDVEYDQILEDDFGTATRAKEIDLTLFTLTPELNSRYTDLDGKLERMQNDYDTLVQENRELRSQKDVASDKVKELQTELIDARVASIEKARSQGYKDDVDGLKEEVTQFVGSGMESLVQKLLSSDEFHDALARVASLGINYGVERGLRMRRTDAEFEAVAQKVSNFHVGAKADFDKALVDFPTIPFPFLSKIVTAFRGTLFEVTQVLPDKHIRSVLPASVVLPIVNEDADQVILEHPPDALAATIHRRAFVGGVRLCASSLPLANLCVSFALVNAYYFLRRFKFSLSASLFCSSDSWITRLVGMPIFAGITASVPYARLNGVSPLLVLGYEPITHLTILLPMLLLLDVASF
ncbi:hypothetical protein Tco_0217635 [Tanacetum coccineum]